MLIWGGRRCSTPLNSDFVFNNQLASLIANDIDICVVFFVLENKFVIISFSIKT